MPLLNRSCWHAKGTECIIKTYRECSECGWPLPASAEDCKCGATRLSPVLEYVICLECEHTWTRIRENTGYAPAKVDANLQTVNQRFAALACARGLLYAAVFRVEHDKTIPPVARARAGLKLLHAMLYVLNEAICEGEHVH